MTSPRLSMRRHLALMSATDREASSSRYILAWLNVAVAMATRFHSSSPTMRPLLSFLLSIRHSVATRRIPSWARLISRENTATLLPECLAASAPMFMAREDLPMPGRPATMIRSELFSPEMRRSRSMRPVEMPVNSPPWACRS